MTAPSEDERPTFREWLEANGIREQLTTEQWVALMEYEGSDLDAQFMTFSVSHVRPGGDWEFRHDLWKRYGRDTGAGVFEEPGRYKLTWPEALRTNYQEWERP